jgi:hypothetical protein
MKTKRRLGGSVPGAIIVLACVAFLPACAAPARPELMTAVVADSGSHAMVANSPLRQQVWLASVTGGEPTNPIWTSEVGNSEFREALRRSLDGAGFAASDDGGRFSLHADLIRVDQPLIGFSITVTSTAGYRLVDDTTNETVFSETIIAPYTAGVGDAFLGVERLRIANEGSIRQNIAQFIQKLIERFDTIPQDNRVPEETTS